MGICDPHLIRPTVIMPTFCQWGVLRGDHCILFFHAASGNFIVWKFKEWKEIIFHLIFYRWWNWGSIHSIPPRPEKVGRCDAMRRAEEKRLNEAALPAKGEIMRKRKRKKRLSISKNHNETNEFFPRPWAPSRRKKMPRKRWFCNFHNCFIVSPLTYSNLGRTKCKRSLSILPTNSKKCVHIVFLKNVPFLFQIFHGVWTIAFFCLNVIDSRAVLPNASCLLAGYLPATTVLHILLIPNDYPLEYIITDAVGTFLAIITMFLLLR